MQFDALFGCVVLLFNFFHGTDGARVNDIFMAEGVKFDLAGHQNINTVVKLVQKLVALFNFHDHGNHKRIGFVGNIKGNDFVLAFFAGMFIEAEHPPPNDNRDGLHIVFRQFNVGNGHRFFADNIAVNRADAFEVIADPLFDDMFHRFFIGGGIFFRFFLFHNCAGGVFLLHRRGSRTRVFGFVNILLHGLQFAGKVRGFFGKMRLKPHAEALQQKVFNHADTTRLFQNGKPAVFQMRKDAGLVDFPVATLQKTVGDGDRFFQICNDFRGIRRRTQRFIEARFNRKAHTAAELRGNYRRNFAQHSVGNQTRKTHESCQMSGFGVVRQRKHLGF